MPKAYLIGPGDKRRRKRAKSSKRERQMNPVTPGSERPRPARRRNPATMPPVSATLEGLRTLYDRDTLSEEDALNLICDPREGEPGYWRKSLYADFGNWPKRRISR